jgi:hypothetical protein
MLRGPWAGSARATVRSRKRNGFESAVDIHGEQAAGVAFDDGPDGTAEDVCYLRIGDKIGCD